MLLEREWIPKTEGCALYIRPTMIATDPFLGVRPSNSYLFYIIVGPVAAYYPEGFHPVIIFATDKYVRGKGIAHKERKIQVADGKTGPLSHRLYDTLLAIQDGTGEDRHGWCVRIDV